MSGSVDRTIRVWNMRSGECVRLMQGHTGGIWCLQFDKEKVVSGAWDTTIKVWDMKGVCQKTLVGHTDTVSCLEYNDEVLVSGSHDKDLRVWSVVDWEETVAIRGAHSGCVYCLHLVGDRVVSGSADKTAKLWDVRTGEREKTYRGFAHAVMAVRMNARHVVAGSWDSIHVFDRKTELRLHVMVGHMGRVETMWLRGERLISGARDKLLKEWDVKRGHCLRTFKGHAAAVTSVQFNDYIMVSASEDHTIQMWDVPALSNNETDQATRMAELLESAKQTKKRQQANALPEKPKYRPWRPRRANSSVNQTITTANRRGSISNSRGKALAPTRRFSVFENMIEEVPQPS